MRTLASTAARDRLRTRRCGSCGSSTSPPPAPKVLVASKCAPTLRASGERSVTTALTAQRPSRRAGRSDIQTLPSPPSSLWATTAGPVRFISITSTAPANPPRPLASKTAPSTSPPPTKSSTTARTTRTLASTAAAKSLRTTRRLSPLLAHTTPLIRPPSRSSPALPPPFPPPATACGPSPTLQIRRPLHRS